MFRERPSPPTRPYSISRYPIVFFKRCSSADSQPNSAPTLIFHAATFARAQCVDDTDIAAAACRQTFQYTGGILQYLCYCCPDPPFTFHVFCVTNKRQKSTRPPSSVLSSNKLEVRRTRVRTQHNRLDEMNKNKQLDVEVQTCVTNKRQKSTPPSSVLSSNKLEVRRTRVRTQHNRLDEMNKNKQLDVEVQTLFLDRALARNIQKFSAPSFRIPPT
ncbi:hypothetical protein J6590_039161 [Homalodisca vitripennis]|nr:hypothetical protein J6590_039161 [Homalodisca vitripennis]